MAVAINVTAVIPLPGRVLPKMIATGWGRIVNISSGIVAHPRQ
jgi:short-subunit dehydrogenase